MVNLYSICYIVYHFEEDCAQNHLVFQPTVRYFKVNIIANTNYISSWKSAECIKPPTTCDNSLTPSLNYYVNKVRVTFTGSCLKQTKISFTHEKLYQSK